MDSNVTSHYVNPMIPRLTHLQFLVLGILLAKANSGKQVRVELKRHGATKSGPAFYQLMARLEDDGLVRGRYEQEVLDAQIIRERHYEITASGKRAWSSSRDFYVDMINRYGDEPILT